MDIMVNAFYVFGVKTSDYKVRLSAYFVSFKRCYLCIYI